MTKKLKLIAIVALIIICVSMFSACELNYGDPDKLDIAGMDVGQRIWIGLQVAFLGIAMVFIVLFLLIGFVVVMKYAFLYATTTSKNKKLSKKEKIEDVAQKSVANDDVVLDAPVVGSQEDEDTVAAITAAIMAYYDANITVTYKSNVKFRVRSIKEIK